MSGYLKNCYERHQGNIRSQKVKLLWKEPLFRIVPAVVKLQVMRRIKFYVPGLFSLLLLFPLLMYQLTQWGVFEKDRVLEVNWHSPDMTIPYGREFPPSKHYTVINLTGNTSDDRDKIQFVRLLINEIVTQLDEYFLV